MAAGHRGAVAVAACAAAVALIALAGPAARQAASQEPIPTPIPIPAPAAANPLAGDGMWIWYVSKSGGSAKRIAAKAKRRGIEVVLIKSGDAGRSWSQFTPSLVSALKARGLRVCAWQFVYGDRPKAEARVGAGSVARGADCLVIDAEGHYEGEYAEASTYMTALRARIGESYPLALSSFPYADYHPAFPYSVFLGPGGAQYNLPQLYWKTIGDSVDESFVHTYVFNRAYGRPILPTGQTYLNPKSRQVRRFRRLALAHGMEGVSWWSWQHSGNRQWKAVGGSVAPIAGYQRYDSFPFLRPGSKGDLVAWAQQLLAGGGYSTPVSGYFEAPTRSAVLALQATRGLAQTGSIDVPTWDVLLTHTPLRVRWTKSGAIAASGGGALAEPRSAKLPAKAFEIPRFGGSDRP
ncbi:MAG: peptidoglycan-binding protein [Actinomycetota bacterium]|nr:peptidoglycan-binding protein [Actinomycetota bacterium]